MKVQLAAVAAVACVSESMAHGLFDWLGDHGGRGDGDHDDHDDHDGDKARGFCSARTGPSEEQQMWDSLLVQLGAMPGAGRAEDAVKALKLVSFFCAGDLRTTCGLGRPDQLTCPETYMQTCAACFDGSVALDRPCLCECEQDEPEELSRCVAASPSWPGFLRPGGLLGGLLGGLFGVPRPVFPDSMGQVAQCVMTRYPAFSDECKAALAGIHIAPRTRSPTGATRPPTMMTLAPTSTEAPTTTPAPTAQLTATLPPTANSTNATNNDQLSEEDSNGSPSAALGSGSNSSPSTGVIVAAVIGSLLALLLIALVAVGVRKMLAAKKDAAANVPKVAGRGPDGTDTGLAQA
jgi:hypothetical protein